MSESQSHGTAFKNCSMLEEIRLSKRQIIERGFAFRGVRYVQDDIALGHVFSVLTEELLTVSPSLTDFLEDINERLRKEGEGHLRTTDPFETVFGSRTSVLCDLLRNMMDNDRLSLLSAVKVIEAAQGGYDYEEWARVLHFPM